MKLLCKLFGHHWNGCCCTRGDARRDTAHVWDGCTCKICHSIRESDHDWDGCKCRKCDKVRDEGHAWDGCICTRCKGWRDQEHITNNGVCTKCGENVTSSTCAVCGKAFLLNKRKRGTIIPVCEGCYYKLQVVGRHRVFSYNAPTQWDTEVVCVNCGQITNYYDNGASAGVDFKQTPCR